jgi:hypothetical protein
LKNRYNNRYFLKFRYLLICKSDEKLTAIREYLKKQIYIPKMNRGKEEIDRLVVGVDKRVRSIYIHFTIEEKLSLTTINTFESGKIRIEHGT